MTPFKLVEILTKKAKTKYYSYKVGAKTRKLAFDLTFNQFRELIAQDCGYCGTPSVYNTENQESLVNGIDRIDSSKGYHLTNCRPCCSKCNYMKRALGEYVFVEHISKIYHNLELFRVYNPTKELSISDEVVK